MKTWKTISKKTVLERGIFLTVEDRVVELPNGRVIPDWTWVIIPDSVNVMAEMEDGRFLFFRQTKYALKGEALAPVGGFINPGETPDQAARRELMEEAGGKTKDWTKLGDFRVEPNRGVAMCHLFLARGVKVVAKPSGDDLEEQRVVMLSRTEVEKSLNNGEFKVVAWAALVLLALRQL